MFVSLWEEKGESKYLSRIQILIQDIVLIELSDIVATNADSENFNSHIATCTL